MYAHVMLAGLALVGIVSAGGNGKLKQERREVGDFHALSVGTGLHATVSVGAKAEVTLEGDENLLPLVETTLKGGTLVVRARQTLRPTKPIRVTVTAPRLDEVVASGGARVQAVPSPGAKLLSSASGGATLEVSGIDSEEVVVRASGGARSRLLGKAKRLQAEASGGATVDTSALPVESASVVGSGGARLELYVANEFVGRASGGASIHLKGNPPKRTVSTSGGGRLVVGE